MKLLALFALLLPTCLCSNALASLRSNSASLAFKKVNPAVVGIFNFSKVNTKKGLDSLGSGFFYGSECLIITNYHVVEGADVIGVSVFGKRRGLKAKLLGFEKRLDVALLKLDKKIRCRPVSVARPKTLSVGHEVFAIGNPVGLERTLTSGIVSALNRSIDNSTFHRLIQTDAALFPGNSGGPLINEKGEAVGVNTLSSRLGSGLAFAVPMTVLVPLFPEILKNGSLKKRTLGIKAKQFEEKEKLTLSDYLGGVLVGAVYKKGPAKKSGLRENDLIIESNGKPLRSIHDLEMELYSNPLGSSIKLIVVRNQKEMSISIPVQ